MKLNYEAIIQAVECTAKVHTGLGVVIECGIGIAMAAVISNADIFVDNDGEPIFVIFSIRSDSMGLGNILY